MIRVRKSLLYFITFLVFLFAIVAGLQRIGALDRHSPGKSVDFSSVQNIFDNAKTAQKQNFISPFQMLMDCGKPFPTLF